MVKTGTEREFAHFVLARASGHRYLAEGPYWLVRDPSSAVWRRDWEDLAIRRAAFDFASAKDLASSYAFSSPTLVRAHPDMQLSRSQLDQDPHLLPTSNGVINLRSGCLIPPSGDPGAGPHFTRGSSVAYDPDAKAPLWAKFLETTFPDFPLRDYVQKLLGYALSGDVGAEKTYFAYGTGRNGKTKLLEAVGYVLGDFYTPAPPNFLAESPSPVASAELYNRRLVVAQELAESQVVREDHLKRITGGNTLTGAGKWQHPFSFRPTHKLWVEANHLPNVGSDLAVWERIRIIPFEHTVLPQDRDPNLQDKLREEAPGILAWLVEGAKRYYAEGLDDEPDKMTSATKAYQEIQDIVPQFVDQCCQRDPSMWVLFSELYARLVQFADQEGSPYPSKKGFAHRLVALGYVKHDGQPVKYQGLTVI